jgi:hypothetical protein
MCCKETWAGSALTWVDSRCTPEYMGKVGMAEREDIPPARATTDTRSITAALGEVGAAALVEASAVLAAGPKAP